MKRFYNVLLLAAAVVASAIAGLSACAVAERLPGARPFGLLGLFAGVGVTVWSIARVLLAANERG